jgi:hypothetical protein
MLGLNRGPSGVTIHGSHYVITGAYKYSAVQFAVVVFIVDNENTIARLSLAQRRALRDSEIVTFSLILVSGSIRSTFTRSEGSLFPLTAAVMLSAVTSL